MKSLFYSDFKCSTWSWTAVLPSWSLGKGFGLSRNVGRRKRSHGSWVRSHQKTVDHQWKIFKKITKWKSSNCFSGWTFHLPMCCSVSYLHCLNQHQLKNFVKSKFPNSQKMESISLAFQETVSLKDTSPNDLIVKIHYYVGILIFIHLLIFFSGSWKSSYWFSFWQWKCAIA